MASVSAFFRRILTFRKPRTPPGVSERLSWLLQPYLTTLEDVLLWANPVASTCFLIFVNVFMWVLRESGARPLGILGGALFLGALLDAVACALGAGRRAPQQVVRQHIRLSETVVRLRSCCAAITCRLKCLRRDEPSQFCVVSCAWLGVLWVAGWFGGAVLLHVCTSLLLAAPLLPAALPHPDSDGEVEGFLPELSALALEELQRAGEHAPPAPSPIDLSLPPDMSAALRYAAGEASSSEEEGGDGPRAPSLASTDSSDSDTEFLPKGAEQVRPERMEHPLPSQLPAHSQPPVSIGWLSSLLNRASGRMPTAAESDSDEFELVDQNDL